MIIVVVVKTLSCKLLHFSLSPTHPRTAGGLQGATAATAAAAMGGQRLGGLNQMGLGGLGKQQQLGIG